MIYSSRKSKKVCLIFKLKGNNWKENTSMSLLKNKFITRMYMSKRELHYSKAMFITKIKLQKNFTNSSNTLLTLQTTTSTHCFYFRNMEQEKKRDTINLLLNLKFLSFIEWASNFQCLFELCLA